MATPTLKHQRDACECVRETGDGAQEQVKWMRTHHKMRQLIIFCIKLNASHRIQLVFWDRKLRAVSWRETEREWGNVREKTFSVGKFGRFSMTATTKGVLAVGRRAAALSIHCTVWWWCVCVCVFGNNYTMFIRSLFKSFVQHFRMAAWGSGELFLPSTSTYIVAVQCSHYVRLL